MKITEVKQSGTTSRRSSRFSPKFPEKLDEGPCDVAEKSDIEKMTSEQYVKYTNWKKECEEAEKKNSSADDDAELDKMFDGKSPHKKGTKKYNKQMAAIHANEGSSDFMLQKAMEIANSPDIDKATAIKTIKVFPGGDDILNDPNIVQALSAKTESTDPVGPTRVDELGRMEFIFDKDEWSEEELESLASMDGAEWDVEAGTITASGHRPATLKVLNRLVDAMPGVERGETSEIPKDQGRNAPMADNRRDALRARAEAAADRVAAKRDKIMGKPEAATESSPAPDGPNYQKGDLVVLNGRSYILDEFDDGIWWATDDDGGDIEFHPGSEDHHEPMAEDSPDNEDWDNDVTKTLRKIVDKHQAQKVKFDNGKKTTVDAFTASAVIQGLEAMRPDLQIKAADFINKSPGHLVKFSEMVFGSQKEGYGESVDPVGLSVNVMREAFAEYEKDSTVRWDKYANYRGLRQKMAHVAKRVEENDKAIQCKAKNS